MEKLTFVVPTLLGVEGLTADELRRMGMQDVRAENGRVYCTGAPADVPRLDLRLRTGERVLIWGASRPRRSTRSSRGRGRCRGRTMSRVTGSSQ